MWSALCAVALGAAPPTSVSFLAPDGGLVASGDVNADGFDDVVFFNDTEVEERLEVYLGSAAGLLAAPQVAIYGVPGGYTLYNYLDHIYLIDVDDDGFDDLVMAGPGARVHLHLGSATGLSD